MEHSDPVHRETDLFPRDLVHGKLVTNVVLPTGYKSRKCWPVLYLLHGTAGPPTNEAPLQWLQLTMAGFRT